MKHRVRCILNVTHWGKDPGSADTSAKPPCREIADASLLEIAAGKGQQMFAPQGGVDPGTVIDLGPQGHLALEGGPSE